MTDWAVGNKKVRQNVCDTGKVTAVANCVVRRTEVRIRVEVVVGGRGVLAPSSSCPTFRGLHGLAIFPEHGLLRHPTVALTSALAHVVLLQRCCFAASQRVIDQSFFQCMSNTHFSSTRQSVCTSTPEYYQVFDTCTSTRYSNTSTRSTRVIIF